MVPLGGLLLFALISKNIRLMSAATVGGICIYIFFAFTYAGESNYMIRRMRTAFRPNKDASYLVRKQNRQKLAEIPSGTSPSAKVSAWAAWKPGDSATD